MYFPKGSLEMGKPGKFSRIEIFQLILSIGVLTISFSFALTGNNLISGLTKGFLLDSLPFGFIKSFLGVLTAFFFHELSHKFMAQKYGLWSEFRMYPKGLLLSLLFAVFTGFVFAAPGAVMFRGEARKQEVGKIAVAGPLANIIISALAFIMYRLFYETETVGRFLGFIAIINALLGAFNLIPFGPFDGMKVIRWNGIYWAILFAISIMMIILIFPIPTYI